MSAQQAQKSRWGSLLSGAVAGLESRLDNILAEEGSAAAKNAEFERRREEAKKEKAGTLLPLSPASSNSEAALDADSTDFKKNGRMSDDISRQSEGSSKPSLDKADAQTEPQGLPDLPTINAVADESVKAEDALADLKDQMAQVENENNEAESKHQDEIQGYLERIDALQAKLQYLAQDAAKSAAQAAADAADNSLEKKLAAKDEQIALLMEEGTKLSKAEVTQASTIRRLRLKMNEDAKAQSEARRVLAKAELASSGLSDRVARLELEKRDAQSKLTRMTRLEKELGDARRERGTKDATIHDLQSQLAAAKKQADEDARQAAERALEQEKKVSQSLRDDLSNAKIEQTLRDDKAKAQLKESQDELLREKESHRAGQTGLRNEMSILETRLEVMRERSEEASTGSTNDSHAKLMRQVETLQSQYAVASENWQILESSLQSRLTALEKEKDETSRAETEARKKARENGSNARRLQEQLDEVNQQCQILEHELLEQKRVAEKHEARAQEAEKSVADEREKFQGEQSTWETRLQTRIEEERAKWQLQTPKTPGDAPSLLTLGSPRDSGYRRTSGLDLPGLGSRRHTSRGTSDLSLPMFERPAPRRTPTFMSRTSAMSPNGVDSGRSTPGHDPYAIPETPSINTIDADDTEHGSSPHRTVNDMLSATTASAGPSVQLVERMSAAVRRLESEKAATKDELARLSGQRDEARKEVVNLMREVDEKRAIEAKVDKLEKSLVETNGRYTTTLEMLGEKSERVEELEADVADLKKIYRELIDSTMK
ncbi:hypothetical protein FH972_021989 [Carpinus fangiana]|uniref:TATA element modulatory factor 1 TATA binding domain-containing protein n=1 Tax=Carpinus fangiana TaxID=176857 RepID=A0A5N6KRG6_9ROSI|nr:hypothetical protein FH972_021989 [Carpinus fangiana]